MGGNLNYLHPPTHPYTGIYIWVCSCFIMYMYTSKRESGPTLIGTCFPHWVYHKRLQHALSHDCLHRLLSWFPVWDVSLQWLACGKIRCIVIGFLKIYF